MAESQKGATSIVDTKKKSSLLDDEIGKEFLDSWKSPTMLDDSLDFNCETATCGGKKPFSFDKLEMDFALEGGFDKISSFKIDMSDLDFSSPRREAEKRKERSGNEAIPGRHEGKQDRFSFSFDFNELDSFELDSNLLKGEKKSDKHADDKRVDFTVNHGKSQDSRSLATSIDTFEHCDAEKRPTLDTVTTSKFDRLIGSLGQLHTVNDGAPPISLGFGSRNVFHGATSPEKQVATNAKVSRNVFHDANSPEKQVTTNAQVSRNVFHDATSPEKQATTNAQVSRNVFHDTTSPEKQATTNAQVRRNVFQDATSPEKQVTTNAQQSQRECNRTEKDREQSEIKGSTEPNARHDNQFLPVESVSGDGLVPESVPELQTSVCSFDAEVNAKPGTDPDISEKSIASSHSRNSSPVNSYNLKTPPQTCISESQNTHTELQKDSEKGYHVTKGNIIRNELDLGNTITAAAAMTNITRKLHVTKDTGENQAMASKVLQSPLHRKPIFEKLMPMDGKGSISLHSKFLKKPGNTESQVNLVSTSKKLYAPTDKKMEIMNVAPVGEKSQEYGGSDAQAGNQKAGISESYSRAVTKGTLAILGNEKNNKNLNTSGFQVPSAKLPGQMTTPGTPKSTNPKLVVSSIAPGTNSKNISVERHKISPLIADKKKYDISSLKISRSAKSNCEPSNSMIRNEIKSPRHSEGTPGMVVNMASKMAHSTNSETRALLIPSLKRKSIEHAAGIKCRSKSLKSIKAYHRVSHRKQKSSGSFSNK
ncbi:uncharacterized protein LOC143890392 isoform X2 [Tasmannia lanceolata]|uniref:uncharacterized protein LOC143890392 isoform X2 n=1 Tax=Tasmannia lanceolata TaxID=3420 RepID=UPI004062EF97